MSAPLTLVTLLLASAGAPVSARHMLQSTGTSCPCPSGFVKRKVGRCPGEHAIHQRKCHTKEGTVCCYKTPAPQRSHAPGRSGGVGRRRLAQDEPCCAEGFEEVNDGECPGEAAISLSPCNAPGKVCCSTSTLPPPTPAATDIDDAPSSSSSSSSSGGVGGDSTSCCEQGFSEVATGSCPGAAAIALNECVAAKGLVCCGDTLLPEPKPLPAADDVEETPIGGRGGNDDDSESSCCDEGFDEVVDGECPGTAAIALNKCVAAKNKVCCAFSDAVSAAGIAGGRGTGGGDTSGSARGVFEGFPDSMFKP